VGRWVKIFVCEAGGPGRVRLVRICGQATTTVGGGMGYELESSWGTERKEARRCGIYIPTITLTLTWAHDF
jgi:hypothetical protein